MYFIYFNLLFFIVSLAVIWWTGKRIKKVSEMDLTESSFESIITAYFKASLPSIVLVLVIIFNPIRFDTLDNASATVYSYDTEVHSPVEIERHEVDHYQPKDNEQEYEETIKSK